MVSTSIFIDTSWYKAFLDTKDEFHDLAIAQYEKLKNNEASFVTTNFIIDESLTLIRMKSGLPIALKFREMLFEMVDVLKIVRVMPNDETEAWKWFPKDWRRLSFTDCTSFAVMKRIDLKEVATFDEHFARAGFTVFT